VYFEDFAVGMQWRCATAPFTAALIREFAQEWDPMPFHTDAEYAASTRFGGLIASGHQTFLSCWRLASAQNPELIEALVAGVQITERWLAPVGVGDALTGVFAVVGKQQRNAYNGSVFFEFTAHNQRGDCVMTASIEIVYERASRGAGAAEPPMVGPGGEEL